MKAFEEWWLPTDVEDITTKDEITFQDVEDMAEKGWRAALEKVLKDIEEGNLTESYPADILINVERKIKEELES